MKLYRIEVDSWPTDDGKPWPRFIGGPASSYGPWVPEWDELDWFRKLADPETSEVQDDIDEEFSAGYSDAHEIVGWILPDTKRRHYISRAAAYRWVARAQKLGASARVVAPDPITWPEALA